MPGEGAQQGVAEERHVLIQMPFTPVARQVTVFVGDGVGVADQPSTVR